jgi:hypothetical protein
VKGFCKQLQRSLHDVLSSSVEWCKAVRAIKRQHTAIQGNTRQYKAIQGSTGQQNVPSHLVSRVCEQLQLVLRQVLGQQRREGPSHARAADQVRCDRECILIRAHGVVQHAHAHAEDVRKVTWVHDREDLSEVLAELLALPGHVTRTRQQQKPKAKAILMDVEESNNKASHHEA